MKGEENLDDSGIPIHNIEGRPFGCLFDGLAINSMYLLLPNGCRDREDGVRQQGRHSGLPLLEVLLLFHRFVVVLTDGMPSDERTVYAWLKNPKEG